MPVRVWRTSHSTGQITRRRFGRGKLPGRECGAGCPPVKVPSLRQATESFARIGVTGGRSPEGAVRRREAAAAGTQRMTTRGSKGRSPWNAGMQGAIVQWPLARRRHNEIGRIQQRATVFVEAAPHQGTTPPTSSSLPLPSLPQQKKRPVMPTGRSLLASNRSATRSRVATRNRNRRRWRRRRQSRRYRARRRWCLRRAHRSRPWRRPRRQPRQRRRRRPRAGPSGRP